MLLYNFNVTTQFNGRHEICPSFMRMMNTYQFCVIILGRKLRWWRIIFWKIRKFFGIGMNDEILNTGKNFPDKTDPKQQQWMKKSWISMNCTCYMKIQFETALKFAPIFGQYIKEGIGSVCPATYYSRHVISNFEKFEMCCHKSYLFLFPRRRRKKNFLPVNINEFMYLQ